MSGGSEKKAYEGQSLTVTFEAGRCRHAAECVRGLPEVFDIERRPWIQPDNAAVDPTVEVVRRCPSGALGYRLASGAAEASGRSA
ncbi:zinc finger CDGSH type superfamily protein [Streptomonospora alba]|uniref:Zinc finger CDGSH type superfamily protein n=1 Tax=Streptomonospora alba TaxID=183763 RepID=A0A0C2JLU2_9ACTN|nr:(4Fe-4S)-binding protein [Streptomonospora alba]KIH97812.1 zinc finger CDGSH type superfamily protein [Streptomonospora alba]